MRGKFDDRAAAELKAQLRDLFEGLDADELRTVAAQVNDLIRAGDAHASRHAGGPVDPDDDDGDDGFEQHRRGLQAMYPDLSAAELRRKFVDVKAGWPPREKGWPPQATDQYTEPDQRTGAIGDVGRGAAGGPAHDRDEAPAGGLGAVTSRRALPAQPPFQGGDDPRLGVNVRGPDRTAFRQFSEQAAHSYKIKTAASLSKILTTLSEAELGRVIAEHARQHLVG
jgi:hypothetical protein